jgi:hypothetical protein
VTSPAGAELRAALRDTSSDLLAYFDWRVHVRDHVAGSAPVPHRIDRALVSAAGDGG